MSFKYGINTMSHGQVVILYLNKDAMYTVTLKQGESFQTKYGCLRHNDLIGKDFGSKVNCSNGFVYALKPTPELWTLNLPHRTQILYSTDISMVIFQLDLRPGSIVVESGTGSASLSHAFIRTIAPQGHLYTYEFHQQRAEAATKEFEEHGYADNVTVTHRDVCENGFTVTNKADAVFLDLPNPHVALKPAVSALKLEGGRLCSFSPCIEQVQRTCQLLDELDFHDINTLEVLLTNLEIRTVALHQPDMGGTLSDSKSDFLSMHAQPDLATASFKTALPNTQQPGHTGYLTFATLYARASQPAIVDPTDIAGDQGLEIST